MIATEIDQDAKDATCQMLEQLADRLARRVYSPRIRLLTIAQIEEATGVAKTAIYQLIRDGDFPAPVKIGRQNRWRESSLIRWLDSREGQE